MEWQISSLSNLGLSLLHKNDYPKSNNRQKREVKPTISREKEWKGWLLEWQMDSYRKSSCLHNGFKNKSNTKLYTTSENSIILSIILSTMNPFIFQRDYSLLGLLCWKTKIAFILIGILFSIDEKTECNIHWDPKAVSWILVFPHSFEFEPSFVEILHSFNKLYLKWFSFLSITMYLSFHKEFPHHANCW